MQSSKVSRLFFLLSAVCGILGCSSSSYRVFNQDGMRTELLVTPDRVLLECEKIDQDRSGFMILILDDENTVVDATQTNVLDAESCNKRVKKIGDILKQGKRIYIAGYGEMKEPKVREKWSHSFNGKGVFYGNGRGLQFKAIRNEKGKCFDAQTEDKGPCPSSSFPIGEYPY